MLKRTFDIVLSSTGLFLLCLPILALVLIVRLTSPGPGFFAQQRIGRDCKPFACYKLRTMYLDTPFVATHEIEASSVTPVGRWLRRLKLDELPQLWNVLRGDMSLVGPRPCLPLQAELIEKRRQRGVFRARPGISGRAQVLGVDMSDPDRLCRIDAEYIATQSFVGDLILLAKTFTRSAQGDRVRA
jgi:O-antigen biosynthesis protein WbqP